MKYQPLQTDAEFVWTEVFAVTVFRKPGNPWMLLYKYLQPSHNQDLFLDLLGHWKQRSKHEWLTRTSVFQIQFLNIHKLYSKPCKHNYIYKHSRDSDLSNIVFTNGLLKRKIMNDKWKQKDKEKNNNERIKERKKERILKLSKWNIKGKEKNCNDNLECSVYRLLFYFDFKYV